MSETDHLPERIVALLSPADGRPTYYPAAINLPPPPGWRHAEYLRADTVEPLRALVERAVAVLAGVGVLRAVSMPGGDYCFCASCGATGGKEYGSVAHYDHCALAAVLRDAAGVLK